MFLSTRQGIRSHTAPRIRVSRIFFTLGCILISDSLIGLEHATIKDNIIFGCPDPFDEVRYQSVLDACALRQDLAIFNAGDLTGLYLFTIAFALY